MIRKLSIYPDPVLRKPTEDIEVIDDKLRTLVDDMIDTMYAAKGVGLAAPQVGVSLRLAVIDTSETRDEAVAYINPEIIKRSGKDTCEEACLSLPGVGANVTRAAKVRVRAQLITGEEVEVDAEGLMARAFQHELDHLDGIIFTDKAVADEKEDVREQLEELVESQING